MTIFQLKPKYYFGVGALNNLAAEIKRGNYKNPLILFGGGSIKNNGVYDTIIKQLAKLKIQHFEFGGIEPNPHDTTVFEAATFCKKNKIDLIIAAGGGSVIDSAKVIATLAKNDHITNTWDYVTHKEKAPNFPIDIFSVITLAGTASENNGGSVITNVALKRKQGVQSPNAVPKVVFEDATYTLTLSNWQMASGMFDCLSHLLEQYYDEKTFYWTLEMQLGHIICIIQLMILYMKDKANLATRENIMWTCSMALNGLTSFNSDGDWNVHTMEHALSALYDVTHGAGLALITPHYIEYRSAKEEWFKDRTILLANRLYGPNASVKTLTDQLSSLIRELQLPQYYKDFAEIEAISEDDFKWMAKHAFENSSGLTEKEYLEIFKLIPIKRDQSNKN